MKKYKNFPMVPRIVFGEGSFQQLGDILLPKRKNSEAPFIFFVDAVFETNTELIQQLPMLFDDKLIFITTEEEPKTSQIDALVTLLSANYDEFSGIVGIGGGTVLDIAKAVSIMLTNPGKAEEYQGWDLVKIPALYHVGIPTLSGTGAEVSRTTVLTGPEKKLGINSDTTPFDQVILDPDLTKGVSKTQRFFTGMDCFIHSVESLDGYFLNAFSQSYGEKAHELCLEVFLENHLSAAAMRNKLMVASWHGGMSIAYSQVGVAHAMSYGLGFLLGIKHGVGNCMVFDHLEEFYPKGVKLFKQMQEKEGVALPTGVCAHLSDAEFDTLASVAMGLAPLWENALGKDWKSVITPKKLRSLYEKI